MNCISVSSSNTAFCSVDGVLFNKDCTSLIRYPANKQGESYQIPEGTESIDHCGFRGCNNLVEITMPQTIRSIGDAAFNYCSKIKNLILPDFVTEISFGMFSNCYSLETLTLPNNLEYISGSAGSMIELKKIIIDDSNVFFTTIDGVLFDKKKETLICYPTGKADTEYVVPENVVTIGNGSSAAFEGCINLTKLVCSKKLQQISDWAITSKNLNEVVLNEGLIKIGAYAFYCCSGITDITFPKSLLEIGTGAFDSCTQLKNVTILGDNTSIGANAFHNTLWEEAKKEFFIVNKVLISYKGSDENVIIPEGVVKIGERAFNGCSTLVSVTIPETVTEIGVEAFLCCRNLKNITFPDQLKTIRTGAFSGSGLETINGGNNIEYIESVAFDNTPWFLKQGDFPNVNGILLKYCGNDSNVIIPDSVVRIAPWAFWNCSNVKKVQLPNNLVEIGNNAFDAVGLTEIILPDPLRTIGDDAFSGTKITTLSIPKNVSQIGYLKNVPTLKEIIVDTNNKYYSSKNGVLFDKNQKTLICLPSKKPEKEYTIPSSVTTIADNAAGYYEGVIVFSENIKYISDWAFNGCRFKNDILKLKNVSHIGEFAFTACDMKDVILEGQMDELSQNIFYYCYSLENVTFGAGITEISDLMFRNCASLTNVSISNTVKVIGKAAFYQCNSLKNIVISEGVTEICEDAFNMEKEASVSSDIEFSILSNSNELQWVAIYNSNCNIKDKESTIYKSATIYGKKNSTAQKYAQKYNRKFVEIQPLTILKHPSSVTASSGKTIHLSVKAIGNNVTYQWQKYDSTKKAWSNCRNTGFNTSDMSFSAQKQDNGKIYRCVIKDCFGNAVTSKNCKLIVSASKTKNSIKILSQPKNIKIKKGKKASFKIKAKGYKLRYQWQYYSKKSKKWKSAKYKGNKKNSIIFKVSKKHNNLKLRCIITDGYKQKKISKTVRLKVK